MITVTLIDQNGSTNPTLVKEGTTARELLTYLGFPLGNVSVSLNDQDANLDKELSSCDTLKIGVKKNTSGAAA